MKRTSEMTEEERSEYEQAVLEATREAMQTGQPGFKPPFLGAELSGRYPDTQITVRYWDPRFDREHVHRNHLWKAVTDEKDIPETPVRAAVLIKVWALGG